MKCPHCQTENSADAKFCNQCGARLTAAPDITVSAGRDLNVGEFVGRDKTTTASVSAGDSGVAVGGTVLGDVLVNAVKIVIENPAARAEAELALREYLRFVIRSCARITRIPGGRTDREPPELADVYVPLYTTHFIPVRMRTLAEFFDESEGHSEEHKRLQQETVRSVTVLEALTHHRELVLLGKPGSGKSTFVSFVSLVLARAGLSDKAALEEMAETWTHGALLPVRIVIRRFAEFLAQRNVREGTAADVWDYVSASFERDGLLPDTAMVVKKVARQAGALFMFDGLDEAPTLREQVLQAVTAFQKTAGDKSRFVITARPYAWPHARQAVHGEYALTDLSEEQVALYVERWCQAMVRLQWLTEPDAQAMQTDLEQAVKRPDLQPIVTVPLLLNMTASVRTAGGRFPDDRVDLYNSLVTLMLETWNRASDSDRALLDALSIPGLTLGNLRGVLQRVAYDAHTANVGRDGTADVDEHMLKRAFRKLLNDSDDKAAIVINYIEQRAGLLIGLGSKTPDDPRQYTFPHRTFQEYLAACHLAERPDFEKETRRLAEAAPDHWHEALAMAARIAGAGRGAMAAYRLVGLCGPDEHAKHKPFAPDDWRRALLAAEQLLEIGSQAVKQDEATQRVSDMVVEWLLRAMTHPSQPPRDRAHAGDVLARLGDPRFDPDRWHLPREPLWGFVRIGEGPFVMGSKATDEFAEKDEQPQHTVTLPHYYIARYPVTVAQYRAFVTATGYDKTRDNWQNDWPTRPVRYVTWYDALVYCDWLTETLKKSSDTPPELARLLQAQWRVTLPTEAQWEKAARGPFPAKRERGGEAGGRAYPWSNAFDPARANTSETDIGDTSVVGCFPGDDLPYGLLDMSGNVWEWARSKYRTYPYQSDGRETIGQSNDARVVRGGSFYINRRGARCASRNASDPDGRDINFGFRVVVSHSS